ncbi:hypothetical protein DSAG12_00019 [Promethearchaeum syntrophicum]|uniref:Uncharacterized protein n=1 Tax=Promethearchaeum syntrophicum TaxID=2594042 RepID=A0A5B9D513_9ARCH|nr:hypothetical protein [Candidatus Prometheoarchaeum syntrophicum]QEE14208.1 hypothetical protein DSAG12_00019 [Candidatus Prometheoarchaeum syntrophicum]
MMEVSIQEQIAQIVRYTLKFRSEISHQILDSVYPERNLKDFETIENKFPGIIDNIAKIAYEETFGQVSGSNLTRSLKIKNFMSKRYDHLREIIGEKRFDKFVDFPEKIRTWRHQNLSEQQIEIRFVKSVIQLYLTAAKRDLAVFQVELLPLFREWIKISLESNNKNKYAIDPLTLDKITRKFLRTIDLGRVEDEFKHILRDLQTYSMLIFFVKKYPDYSFINEGAELVSNLDNIRKIIENVIQKLQNVPKIDELIFQSYKLLQKEN